MALSGGWVGERTVPTGSSRAQWIATNPGSSAVK